MAWSIERSQKLIRQLMFSDFQKEWLTKTTYHYHTDKQLCQHFFIFREVKEYPSCTGIHYVRCLFCDENIHNATCDHVAKTLDDCHLHAWEQISDRTFICKAYKTDLINSTGRITYRIPCDLLLDMKTVIKL